MSRQGLLPVFLRTISKSESTLDNACELRIPNVDIINEQLKSDASTTTEAAMLDLVHVNRRRRLKLQRGQASLAEADGSQRATPEPPPATSDSPPTWEHATAQAVELSLESAERLTREFIEDIHAVVTIEDLESRRDAAQQVFRTYFPNEKCPIRECENLISLLPGAPLTLRYYDAKTPRNAASRLGHTGEGPGHYVTALMCIDLPDRDANFLYEFVAFLAVTSAASLLPGTQDIHLHRDRSSTLEIDLRASLSELLSYLVREPNAVVTAPPAEFVVSHLRRGRDGEQAYRKKASKRHREMRKRLRDHLGCSIERVVMIDAPQQTAVCLVCGAERPLNNAEREHVLRRGGLRSW